MQIEQMKLIDSSEGLYKPLSYADHNFNELSQVNDQQSHSQQQENPRPMENIAGFCLKKSNNINGNELPDITQTMEIEDDEDFFAYSCSGQSENSSELCSIQTNNNQSTSPVTNTRPRSSVEGYHKNFLVVLSGWLTNHYNQLLKNQEITQQVYDLFLQIVDPTDNLSQQGKIYVNLIKLSSIFDNDDLRTSMESFLDSGFLRALMCSKTKNKAPLLTFLPILKLGFINRRITRLR